MNITRPTPQEALRMRRDAQARSRKCAECGIVLAKTNTAQFKDDPRWLCVGEGTNDCFNVELEKIFKERGL